MLIRDTYTLLPMRSVVLICALGALLPVTRETGAQQPGSARRLSYSVGVSKGTGALTCGFCTGDGKGGLAGMIGVETPFRPAVRLGLEADWWVHSSGGATRSVLAVLPVMHVQRSASSPLFVKFGLGAGRFSATSDEEELRTTALSAIIGAGYQFRLASRNALVPYVSWISGGRGTMRLNGARVGSFGGLSLLQYGLAFSKR
jgi:hypothetical protein